jgi:hypothetical protein
MRKSTPMNEHIDTTKIIKDSSPEKYLRNISKYDLAQDGSQCQIVKAYCVQVMLWIKF